MFGDRIRFLFVPARRFQSGSALPVGVHWQNDTVTSTHVVAMLRLFILHVSPNLCVIFLWLGHRPLNPMIIYAFSTFHTASLL